MTIENTFVVKIDTPMGLRYFVLFQEHSYPPYTMKNERKIPNLSMITESQFNPWGFGTLEEIRELYDRKRYEDYTVPFPTGLNHYNHKRTSFWGDGSKPIMFFRICDFVTEALKAPVTLQELFGYIPNVDISFEKDKAVTNFENIPFSEALEEWIKRKDDYSILHMSFREYFWAPEQRKQVEKGYFLISICDPIYKNRSEYLSGRRKNCFIITKEKSRAKQFKSENEAFAYIKKHESSFGDFGYTVEEIPGMTVEKGLEKL